MAQLIKLQNYTSRYEQNIFHYPSRFVMLKKQQWEKWQEIWRSSTELVILTQPAQEKNEWEEEKKRAFLRKIKTLFWRKQEGGGDTAAADESVSDHPDEGEKEEFSEFPPFFQRPETIEELKHLFLNHLFNFQLKWAAATLTEKSNLNKKYLFDERLKYFLTRFPDTYLLMYRPVFLLKRAPVEGECILIGPTDIWCITFIEDQELSVFTGSKEKFWEVRNRKKVKKVLNPHIALNRTEKIVKNILQLNGIEFPIHKVLLSRNGYIDYSSFPFDLKLIDKSKYDDWFQSMRSLRTPLKSTQLKAAKALLEFCQTISIKRQEWEENTEE
ncbi:NERD domain-containing protein [Bacillus benzoevorans]|uniref:NERD domain-containing protein n=1 Tax=Bacillus benzoevorans TaxID=1456 RepID=A0A7X0LWU7_9BACI|nr:NERD domain-containing protein [Bacillus benzoevorans]MBB6445754.1 hypothetical protein [Bacillus benzoevorans]